jgi:hypothetical protein
MVEELMISVEEHSEDRGNLLIPTYFATIE